MKYNKDNPLRVGTLFSGYDSQMLAIRRLQSEFPDLCADLVFWCEIDKHASVSHDLIFPEYAGRNLGDITKVDWDKVPKCDLITWSFPCTDLSSAGQQKGMDKDSGTRSSLCWEAVKCIRALKPKYALMENVPALLQKKFIKDFNKLKKDLEDIGYINFVGKLNAKNFGVPQNRDRVFMVSILKDSATPPIFEFPDPFPLERRLKHVLETDVDESYYFRPEQVQRIVEHCDRKVAEGCGFKPNFQTPDGISGAIKTTEGHREYDTYISEPSIAALRGRDPNNPSSRKPSNGNYEQMLELGPEGLSNTLSTVGKDNLLIEPRIEIVGNVDPVREGGGGLSTTHEAGCIPTKASLVHSLPLTTKSQKLLCSPPPKKKV